MGHPLHNSAGPRGRRLPLWTGAGWACLVCCLAYILPGIIGNLFTVIGLPGWLWQYGSGWPGALNAVALTAIVLAITWGAPRIGNRLKL